LQAIKNYPVGGLKVVDCKKMIVKIMLSYYKIFLKFDGNEAIERTPV
jgi:hypothetical protein